MKIMPAKGKGWNGKPKLTDEEYHLRQNASKQKYQKTERGKIAQEKSKKIYRQTERGKINKAKHDKKYDLGENGYIAKRLKVLLHYSKKHSNSDIPCCRCCGQKSHIDFLDVDHIQGAKNMDSIKELTDLGYSSTKNSKSLDRWLIKKEYLKNLETEHFQILCKNCNTAKGMPRNNMECPMKGKPH